jgi:hypothetical protein
MRSVYQPSHGLSAYRWVVSESGKYRLAQPSDTPDGIVTSVKDGDRFSVETVGEAELKLASLVPGTGYGCGTDGVLVVGGSIGKATSATRILINPGTAGSGSGSTGPISITTDQITDMSAFGRNWVRLFDGDAGKVELDLEHLVTDIVNADLTLKANLSQARTISIPDFSGTMALLEREQTFTQRQHVLGFAPTILTTSEVQLGGGMVLAGETLGVGALPTASAYAIFDNDTKWAQFLGGGPVSTPGVGITLTAETRIGGGKIWASGGLRVFGGDTITRPGGGEPRTCGIILQPPAAGFASDGMHLMFASKIGYQLAHIGISNSEAGHLDVSFELMPEGMRFAGHGGNLAKWYDYAEITGQKPSAWISNQTSIGGGTIINGAILSVGTAPGTDFYLDFHHATKTARFRGGIPVTVDPGEVQIGGGVVAAHGYFQLTPSVVPAHLEGRMYWDSVDHTLSLQSEISGATLQVGQENWVRCVNKTGGTITNGQVVYVDGAQGNRPSMALAIGDTGDSPHHTIGVVTADTANNAEGYVTVLGLVRGINTMGFADGDVLYLSPTVAGGLTNVEPAFPNHRVIVGYALNSTVDGTIFVHIDNGVHYQDFHRQQGFDSRTDATYSFDPTFRVFTISPTGSTFKIWYEGREYDLAEDSCTLPAASGLYFISFKVTNGVPNLVQSTNPWDLLLTTTIPVATIYYYHPTTVYAINEERHGARRNLPWHLWAHKTIGTRYETGLSGTFDNTTLSITQGVIHDEDINFTASGTSTTCRLWRYSGTNSAMYFTTESTPYLVSGGTLQFDSAGTATNVASGKYVINDVYATTDTTSPIWIRVGTTEYATLTDAQAALSTATAAWTGLSLQELKLLYRVIYRNQGGSPTFISATDYRTSSTVPGGGTAAVAPHASSHGSGASDQINALGAVTFTGSAPSSVASGEVKIGGGRVWSAQNGGGPGLILGDTAASGRRWEFYLNGNTANALALYNRTDNNYPIEWLSTGVTVCRGASPSSVASGEVQIGGGKVWSKDWVFSETVVYAGFSGNYGWALGTYSATPPTATGYVTITINGTTYKLLAST